jgi:hypothetical protein
MAVFSYSAEIHDYVRHRSEYSTIGSMICFGGTIDCSLLMQQTIKMGTDFGALEKDFQER